MILPFHDLKMQKFIQLASVVFHNITTCYKKSVIKIFIQNNKEYSLTKFPSIQGAERLGEWDNSGKEGGRMCGKAELVMVGSWLS